VPREKTVPISHRDRVAMALDHQTPDRCPMQISFTPEFTTRLRADLGRQRHLDRYTMLGGDATYELERILDEDMLMTCVGWANSYYSATGTYTDEWGITFRSTEYQTRFGAGQYTEIVGHPLADDGAIDRYQPPDPNRPELYADAQRLLDAYRKEYWIIGATVTTIWETAWALRGLEQMLIDLVADPDLADRILEIPYQFHLAAAKRLVAMGVDMVWTGDDVGTQHAMLISPQQWRRFLKPRMAHFFAELKAINPDVKVAYHCDGDIYPIIPELIEIGMDVLNPVQPASMDPARVKRDFGDRLCFWGTLDEQHTLPFGTPDDVEREVRERLATVGRGGGLILGPTHHVQLDTPLENFWSMVNTITKTPCCD
jgi:uroporphyrinogen decarboxylase